MNKLILIPILLGIVTIVFISIFSISENTSQLQSKSIYEVGFTFYDVDKIKKSLSTQKIFMSSPIEITDYTIGQYCPYFTDIQNPIEHCATTVILDINGNSLGNINMGGTTDGPIMALAIIDSSPFLDSKQDVVHHVFQTMIETLVCDCWEDRQPGGFESVRIWLDAAAEKYSESTQSTLTSKIEGLENMKLILEITSTNENYLWTLIILK
ncbi:MAG: hypothetical protein IIA82_04480 [Thaumarchaeota archaeon]|nr:hypothetical protein [Nitrososphaerota archaeon]MCH8915083.1 hypothetical protein [Nitrososphaerota archaeon]